MKQILMPMTTFIAEHKKLVKILKSGTKKQQHAEAKEQLKELLKHKK